MNKKRIRRRCMGPHLFIKVRILIMMSNSCECPRGEQRLPWTTVNATKARTSFRVIVSQFNTTGNVASLCETLLTIIFEVFRIDVQMVDVRTKRMSIRRCIRWELLYLKSRLFLWWNWKRLQQQYATDKCSI